MLNKLFAVSLLVTILALSGTRPAFGQTKDPMPTPFPPQSGNSTQLPDGTDANDPDDYRFLTAGKLVNGTISPASDVDTYYFWAVEGQTAKIAMNRKGGTLDSYLELYDPEGMYITYDDDGGGANNNALISNVRVSKTGLYEISARSYSQRTSGKYTLRLDLTARDKDDYRTLQPGKPLAGQIKPGSDIDPYLFYAVAGQRITIAMNRTKGTLDPKLNLFGVDDSFIADDDDSGGNLNALIRDFIAPATGTYRVNARSLRGASSGNYTIRLDLSGTNFALNRPAQSWTDDGRLYAGLGNDGDQGTRWSSSHQSSPFTEWWWVDLGSRRTFSQVKINWETAFATEYFVGVSNAPNCLGAYDGYYYSNSSTGWKTHNLGKRTARCVGIMMEAGRSGYTNYSFWEFEVYNAASRLGLDTGQALPDDLILDLEPVSDFSESDLVTIDGPGALRPQMVPDKE